ncbi:BLUF domain-containing protein [Maricaulis sp.]|uniref:BLUF domain-containing protein n=1 Tax=Maricaulis sp. TaxID=1486257 RepID=UPI003453135E
MSVNIKEIIYTSELCSRLSLRNIPNILASIHEVGRRNNFRDRITSVLLCEARRFVQVIEGPEIEVDNLMERLYCNEHHQDIRVVSEGWNWCRGFSGHPLTILNPWGEVLGVNKLDESNNAVADAVRRRILHRLREQIGRPCPNSSGPERLIQKARA